ncbi:Os10g0459550, partial [Oryza sativa Japonica Group]
EDGSFLNLHKTGRARLDFSPPPPSPLPAKVAFCIQIPPSLRFMNHIRHYDEASAGWILQEAGAQGGDQEVQVAAGPIPAGSHAPDDAANTMINRSIDLVVQLVQFDVEEEKREDRKEKRRRRKEKENDVQLICGLHIFF